MWREFRKKAPVAFFMGENDRQDPGSTNLFRLTLHSPATYHKISKSPRHPVHFMKGSDTSGSRPRPAKRHQRILRQRKKHGQTNTKSTRPHPRNHDKRKFQLRPRQPTPRRHQRPLEQNHTLITADQNSAKSRHQPAFSRFCSFG